MGERFFAPTKQVKRNKNSYSGVYSYFAELVLLRRNDMTQYNLISGLGTIAFVFVVWVID